MNLFEDNSSGAIIEGVYRYSLWRIWEPTQPRVLFCMLNPSTADGDKNDPTLRRCLGFAKRWNYGSLEVVNLFAYRATDPDRLAWCASFEPETAIGPENDSYIRQAAERVALCVAAWGAGPSSDLGEFKRRAEIVLPMLKEPHCLGLTASGQPRHPLYVRSDAKLLPYADSATFEKWSQGGEQHSRAGRNQQA